MYFSGICHSYSLPARYDTDDIFKLVDSKDKVTVNFFGEGILIYRLPS